MEVAPSVLLLDDGELDRVQSILKQLEVDFERLRGREIRKRVKAPRDLLVTSGRRALGDMPELELPEDGARPVWVCLHNQDFLPLRQRLRELGVHYLVQGALDQESLRLFLLQLLYRGAERRQCRRLALGGELVYRVGDDERKARLAELSREMCRIVAPDALAPETPVSLVLPAALAGGETLELNGTALRCVEAQTRSGQVCHSVVIRFGELEPEMEERLHAVVSGEQIGTRLTPLAEPPRQDVSAAAPAASAAPVAAPEPEPAPERRGEPRHPYTGRVQALASFGSDAPQLAVGFDLSLSGVRIEGHPPLGVGTRVTVALYGGAREEPAVLEADVVRDDGPEGIALQFRAVPDAQRAQLGRLIGGRPSLQSLRDPSGDDDPVVVSRVTRRP